MGAYVNKGNYVPKSAEYPKTWAGIIPRFGNKNGVTMKAIHVAREILKRANKPLHAEEITKRAIDSGLWETKGKTPVQTIKARISEDIKRNGEQSCFERVGPSIYALRGVKKKDESSVQLAIPEARASFGTVSEGPSYTPTVCAEKVLQKYGGKKPMHYRNITRIAIEEGWLVTRGKTPERSMNARIFTDIRRQKRRGELSRFKAHGDGYIGLRQWEDATLSQQIQKRNEKVREELRKQLLEMSSGDFEDLIYDLFDAMNFEMGPKPKHRADGGIDVRGTLVVDDVVHIEMAVQVKKWEIKRKVHSPVVQNVRGSLDVHERGMIITTSDFSSGAKTEAVQPNKTPIALMNGERLTVLLTRHGFGAVNRALDFLEVDKDSPIWGD